MQQRGEPLNADYQRPPPRPWRRFLGARELPEPQASWRTFWFLLVSGLLYAQLSHYLPLEEEMNRAAGRIILQAVNKWGYGTAGQEKITVIQIDDDDLMAYGEPWPPSYKFHARRLREIAGVLGPFKSRPQAIFIDVLFLDERPGQEPAVLKQAFCDIAAAGVKVYLASLAWTDNDYPRTTELTEPVGGKHCVQAVSVERYDDSVDQSAWAYPLSSGAGHLATSSAALAVFEGLSPENRGKVSFDPPLALIWGMEPHPFNTEWMKKSCRGRTPASVETHALSSYYPRQIVDLNNVSAKPLCPYHRVLPTRVLQDKWIDRDEVREAIQNRAIIYAVNLQSAGDMFRSPIHGYLNGAHLHAMALDNLITLGKDAKRYEKFDIIKEPFSRGTFFSVLAISALSIIMAFGVSFRRRYERSVVRRWVHFVYHYERPRYTSYGPGKRRYYFAVITYFPVRFIVEFGLYALAATAIAVIGYTLFDLGPLAWVEYAAFMMLAHFLHVGTFIENRISKVITHIDDVARLNTYRAFRRRALRTLDPGKKSGDH